MPNHPKTLPPGAEAFVEAIAADYRPEELPGVDARRAGAPRRASCGPSRSAAPGDAPAIRIGPALGADGADIGAELVEIVQPDAPFLVDSVMGELIDAGASVLAMFHPVIETAAGAGARRSRSGSSRWAMDRSAALVEAGLRATLADVRLAVGGFRADGRADGPLDRRAEGRPRRPATPSGLAEDLAFLDWLDADHFVFLGARVYDYPRDADGGYAAEEPAVDADAGLGVLRDPTRPVLRRASEPAVLSAADARASWPTPRR